MAKLKTKVCVMDTKATEVEMGTWEFKTADYMWRWSGAVMGLNTFAKTHEADEWTPILYCKDVNHAVMYAHGYTAGAAKSRHPMPAASV